MVSPISLYYLWEVIVEVNIQEKSKRPTKEKGFLSSTFNLFLIKFSFTKKIEALRNLRWGHTTENDKEFWFRAIKAVKYSIHTEIG